MAILGYISEINEVSGDVVRTKGEHYNIVREDIITHETGSNTEAILNEAPNTEDGYVKVAQVLK
jgi:Asp-tRNA(Asn)/Glu-tRNA(Gln) amidotransferase C subunit